MVDYKSMRESKLFEEFRACALELKCVDLAIFSENERRSFFISNLLYPNLCFCCMSFFLRRGRGARC